MGGTPNPKEHVVAPLCNIHSSHVLVTPGKTAERVSVFDTMCAQNYLLSRFVQTLVSHKAWIGYMLRILMYINLIFLLKPHHYPNSVAMIRPLLLLSKRLEGGWE
jgi:hypothetical protein